MCVVAVCSCVDLLPVVVNGTNLVLVVHETVVVVYGTVLGVTLLAAQVNCHVTDAHVGIRVYVGAEIFLDILLRLFVGYQLVSSEF